MQASIYSAPIVLSFSQPQATQLGLATWKAYYQHTRQAFLQLLGELEASAPGITAGLQQSGVLDDPRFVLAPEASHLAHHVTRDDPERLIQVLEKSMLAELARTTRDTAEFPALWSISGDFFIARPEAGKEQFRYDAPRLHGKIPVDFISPYCAFMRNAELGEADDVAIENYPIEAFGGIVERLETALQPVADSFPEVDAFLARFTLHLVAKINPQVAFASGSNGWYIGRTVLSNVENAAPEILADAMVHEAAHSYLYMLEALQPWMPARERSMELGRSVVSCWTGNKISLRSFSQAIFIWYSLYQFWQGARNKGLYHLPFVTERLQFIENGFEHLQLNEIQELAQGSIPHDSMQVFRKIQSDIVQPQKIKS